MLKIIQNIVKPKKSPTVADCVAAQETFEARLAVLLPKELQVLTIEQWRTFIKEVMEPSNQPQTVSYTLEDGTVVVVAGVVPPLTLVEGSFSDGYVVLSDKLGSKHRVAVTKPSIPQDS